MATSNRGFASMDATRQREAAAKGGSSVSPENRSFAKDRDLAAEAGRKGGQNVAPEDRYFARDPGQAAEAGRRSGDDRRGGQ